MTPEMGEPKQEEFTQERLIGESPDATLEIATEGRVIRPAMAIPAAVVGEFRLHADPDSLWIKAIDPANVAMAGVTVHPEAFERYEAPEEFVTGVDLELLQSQLRGARMGVSSSDPVSLDIDTTRTRIQIERDYEIATIKRTDGFLNIDPDSIRSEPDLPDLEYAWQATIDVQAFYDAVEHLDEVGDHFVVTQSDGDLQFGVTTGDGGDIERAGRVVIPDVVEADEVDTAGEGTSSFSMDYFTDISKACKSALVDDVTLHFGDEIPIRIDFERTDDEDTTLYEGEFLVAPRIQS